MSVPPLPATIVLRSVTAPSARTPPVRLLNPGLLFVIVQLVMFVVASVTIAPAWPVEEKLPSSVLFVMLSVPPDIVQIAPPSPPDVWHPVIVTFSRLTFAFTPRIPPPPDAPLPLRGVMLRIVTVIGDAPLGLI